VDGNLRSKTTVSRANSYSGRLEPTREPSVGSRLRRGVRVGKTTKRTKEVVGDGAMKLHGKALKRRGGEKNNRRVD